jgi:hypothetical protein
MREQYQKDPDFRRRADDAVRHVVAEKVRLYDHLQLSQVIVDPAKATAAAGQGGEAMRSLAEDALTLIQPPSVDELRARLPRGPVTPDRVLIVECWNDCYPYRVMPKLELQNQLLRLYGPDGKGRLRSEDVSTISFAELDTWLTSPSNPANAAAAAAVRDAGWIIFALTEYNPVGRPISGAAKRFLDSAPVDVRNKNLVAIAYNVPYHLDSTEISKLLAYFVVYNKTDAAIETGFRALYGDVTPHGHSPVSVSGIFYNVADAVQPDPQHDLPLSLFGEDPDAARDERTLPLIAGPILDRNGNPVPDGTTVSFSVTRQGSTTSVASAKTTDGIAGARVPISGRGSYSATASVGPITSKALAIEVSGAGATQVTPTSEQPLVDTPAAENRGGRDVPLLAAIIGIPAALALLAGVAGLVFVRRRTARPHPAPVMAATPVSAAATALSVEANGNAASADVPAALRVDIETRRVYVKGVEARPPLSNEQFRLLAYLYERAGKVVAREDLVLHVWPDAHAEGVSEEALDALVRRVRERIAQAGGERSYIITLRGQGFRLEA